MADTLDVDPIRTAIALVAELAGERPDLDVISDVLADCSDHVTLAAVLGALAVELGRATPQRSAFVVQWCGLAFAEGAGHAG